MTTIAAIGISDPDVLRALTAIAAFWHIRIETRAEESDDAIAGLILGNAQRAQYLTQIDCGRPVLGFGCQATDNDTITVQEVAFTSHIAIPEVLRSRSIFTDEWAGKGTLDGLTIMSSVASINGSAIWRALTFSGNHNYLVATPPPRLRETQRLAEVFNCTKLLHILPVWCFIRNLAGTERWQPPPLRACMVVDDPNLHLSTYGYLDYSRLVQFASTQPFHAAIATVPLDGWWINESAASIFRKHPDKLSLLVHGNSHLVNELALRRSPVENHHLVHESLERASLIEKQGQLQIDRIMVPPHGVCSHEMIDALGKSSYEAINTNRWSLWKHVKQSSLPWDSFLRPADIWMGLPIISRFRIDSKYCHNDILLSALLDQPIIPYGHHQNFRNDMATIRSAVDAINRITAVKWMSMRQILESNFEQKNENGVLRVKLFSRRICGVMPIDTNWLQTEIAHSAMAPNLQISAVWMEGYTRREINGLIGDTIAIPAGCDYEIKLHNGRTLHAPVTYEAGRFEPISVTRRLLIEMRDRVAPLCNNYKLPTIFKAEKQQY
jgi:hypothetical protein